MRRQCFLSGLFGAVLLLAGCGPSVHTVTGVVKLDGTPVEGAAVAFMTEDGKLIYSGSTDAGGNFTLSGPTAPGVPAGNYKVTVVKTPKVEIGDATPGSADYLKFMQKEAKAVAPKSGPGMMVPGAKGPAGPAGPKNELPAIYASVTTTTLSAKVPSDGPITLDLTAGKDKK